MVRVSGSAPNLIWFARVWAGSVVKLPEIFAVPPEITLVRPRRGNHEAVEHDRELVARRVVERVEAPVTSAKLLRAVARELQVHLTRSG